MNESLQQYNKRRQDQCKNCKLRNQALGCVCVHGICLFLLNILVLLEEVYYLYLDTLRYTHEPVSRLNFLSW